MSLGKGIGGAASGIGAGAAIGGPVGGIIGGVAGFLGGLFSSDNSEEVQRLQKEAMELYDRFGPVDLSDPVFIRQLTQAGIMSPELEQVINFEQSKKIEENPEMRTEQRAALDAIKQLSRTGMSLEDKAALNEARERAAQDAQAKQQQIMQQMAQRGQAGDGAELAMQIASAQSGAQDLSRGAERVAADASRARRDALSQLFQGSGQMRGVDLDLARANTNIENQDIEFRNRNSQQRQASNVDRLNAAQRMNLERQQGVSDTNIGMANKELYRQRQAKRDYWQDQMTHANAKSRAMQNYANALSGQDAANDQSWNSMWSGIGGVAQAGKDSGLWDSFGNMFKSGVEKPKPGTSSDGLSYGGLGGNYSFNQGFNLAHGGKIEGPEVVKGDHTANDVVPAMLSAGEIVIPKSHATPNKAAEFVEKVNNDNQKPKKNNKKKVLTSLADLLKSLDEMDT